MELAQKAAQNLPLTNFAICSAISHLISGTSTEVVRDPATVEVLREHRRAIHARPASTDTGGDQLVFCEPETHRRLVAISRAGNRPLIDVLRAAAAALERARFATLVASQLDALRHDPEDWARYIAHAQLAVHDGLA